MPPLRAVIYCRVSTAEQAQGYSLDDQVAACLDRCEVRGWEVAGIYRDELPGGFRKRPQLQAALDALEVGRSVFVTWSVERLGRDHAYNWECVRRIREERRCGFSSVTEDLDLDTSAGRLLFGVKGLIAQFGNESRAEDVRRSVEHLAQRGRFAGGFAPYGYRMKHLGKRQGCTLEVVSDQAETVRLMFSWADSGEVGPVAIARRLNNLGLPSPTGRQWNTTSVIYLLRNPSYAGRRVLRSRSDTRFSPSGTRLNLRLPREKWLSYEGEHPAIVPPEQFDRVQDLLNGRKRMARPARYPYLLTGLLRCSCGASMSAAGAERAHGKWYPRYACSDRMSPRMTDCRNTSVSATMLESALIEALRSRSRGGPEWVLDQEHSDPAEALRGQLGRIAGRRSVLLEALETGHLAAEVYASRDADLARREKQLRSRIAEASKHKPRPRPTFSGLADLLESEVPIARKRAALAAAIKQLTWEDGRLRVNCATR